MIKRLKQVTIGFCVVVAAAAAVTTYVIRNREPDLIAASRIAFTVTPPTEVCGWIGLNEVLVDDSSQPGIPAARIDVVTGRKQTITGLSSNGATDMPPPMFAPDRLPISPDCKMILRQRTTNGSEPFGGNEVAYARDLNGHTLGTWPLQSPFDTLNAIWLSDNRHWLEINEMEATGAFSVVRHGIGEKDRRLGQIKSTGFFVGPDRSGRLIMHCYDGRPPKFKWTIRAFDLDTLKEAGVIRLPQHQLAEDVEEIRMSPTGDRLAYTSRSRGAFVYPAWLRSCLPALVKYRHADKQAIWASSADGLHASEIGAIFGRSYNDWELDLRWLPDGKSISFVYHNHLWVAPAN